MKKLIYGLAMCSFALVLAGCGKENKLTCVNEEEGLKYEDIFTFEDKKVSEVKSSLIFESKEEALAAYEIFKNQFDDIKLDDKRIVATLDASYVEEEVGTIEQDEVKKAFEEMGYTCK